MGKPDILEKQKGEIQNKLNKILDIVFAVHGHTKVPDEIVSRFYYSCIESIELVRHVFQEWRDMHKRGSIQDFISKHKSLRIIEIIQGDKTKNIEPVLPFDKDYQSTEEKLSYIINNVPSDIALEFTAARFELSEDRTKKKIKRMYKQYIEGS